MEGTSLLPPNRPGIRGATITRFDAGETEEPDKRWYYLGVALAIWVAFQAATLAGAFLGAWAYPLETSLPGVFAADDARSGSVKRVSSAVGEGSMAL